MSSTQLETATLGGGCFWCLEAAYQEIRGVESIVSGYAGGATPTPTYEQVCSGTTGHAEVVRIGFDPEAVSYRDLLDIFFTIHDPTTPNRQGADVGTQYRSVIFYHDERQRQIAEAAIAELGQAEIWNAPIVTELLPVPEFFAAEPYHQNYYRRNPNQGYCQAVIAPKLSKLRKHHFDRLSRAPAATASGSPAATGQVRPFQGEPRNPLDQGGIAD